MSSRRIVNRSLLHRRRTIALAHEAVCGTRCRLLPAAVLLGLCLPRASIGADDWRYSVRPGDNLWDLTARYLDPRVSYRRLQKLNRVRAPLRLAPGTVLTVPLAWMRRLTDEARVHTVQGRVEIESPDRIVRAAKPGDTLRHLDRIRTDGDGHAALVLPGGTEVRLLADSELVLDVLAQYANARIFDQRLRLVRGRTETTAPPDRDSASRFELTTPAGITSVRGTVFRVAAPPDTGTASAEVLRGTVNAANDAGAVDVTAGFGTRMSAGAPPLPPTPLLPAPALDALPDTLERMPVRIDFAPVDGATAYRVQIAATDTFSPLLFDLRTDAPRAGLAGLDNGTYAIRVRAIDALGLEGIDARRPLRIDARPPAPEAVAPADEALADETGPAFGWKSSVADAPLTWRFQLARDAEFTDRLVDRRDLPAATLQLAGPLAPGVWFWRVGATHATQGDGPFSAARRVRRPSPPPPAATVARTPDVLRVGWERPAGAPSTRVRLAAVDAPESVIVERVVADPETRLPRPAPGRYRITAQTVEPDGFVGPDATVQDFDVPGPPPPPDPVEAPESAAKPVGGAAVALRWQPVDGPVTYRVQIARTADFAAPVADRSTGTDTEFVPETPLVPGRHFWRIAVDSATDGTGAFSAARTLVVVPLAPRITSVATDRAGIVAAWDDTSGTAAYEAQLAASDDFAKPLTTQRETGKRAVFAHPSAGRYFVRVRGIDDEGRPGGWSDPVPVKAGSRLPWWLAPLLIFPLLP